MFSRFGAIPACDRRMDKHTHDDNIYRASIASRGKNRHTSTTFLDIATNFCGIMEISHFEDIKRASAVFKINKTVYQRWSEILAQNLTYMQNPRKLLQTKIKYGIRTIINLRNRHICTKVQDIATKVCHMMQSVGLS